MAMTAFDWRRLTTAGSVAYRLDDERPGRSPQRHELAAVRHGHRARRAAAALSKSRSRRSASCGRRPGDQAWQLRTPGSPSTMTGSRRAGATS